METLNRLRSNRPRRKDDFYETPIELCKSALARVRVDEVYYNKIGLRSLDAGMGSGVWGEAYSTLFSPKTSLFGVDINAPESHPAYHACWKEDYLDLALKGDYKFGFIFGNPPYALAEEFVRKSFQILEIRGYIYFLFRLSFLASKKRHFGLFTEHPPKRVYVLSRRPSFFSTRDGGKTTDALEYAMFLWQGDWRGKTELDWLYWDYEH